MFRWDSRVLYSQLGPDAALSLPALLDLFQNAATLHAEEKGAGLEYLYSLHRAWLLSRWRVRLGELPRSGQTVTVRTRAYECRRALNRRAFVLEDSQGRLLAQADSLWTLVDTDTGAPADASVIVRPYYTPGPGPDLGDLPRKVQTPAQAEEGPAFSITSDLLDTNRHVNNVRSVALAMRFLPEDVSFSALAADYHHPLLPHDQVTPLLAATGRGFAVVLRAGGRDCVSVEFIR